MFSVVPFSNTFLISPSRQRLGMVVSGVFLQTGLDFLLPTSDGRVPNLPLLRAAAGSPFHGHPKMAWVAAEPGCRQLHCARETQRNAPSWGRTCSTRVADLIPRCRYRPPTARRR